VADIVLVDDDALYREALSADLADRGFAVSCFANGHSFLRAMSNGTAARVALLDWVLPEMSGFELLAAMRRRRIILPVIFLTGYSLVEWELQALDQGAVDFVDKARGVEVVAHRLRLIIQSSRALSGGTMTETERIGDLTLLRVTERALWRQQDIGLTVMEYKILLRLVSQEGEPLSYRAIYDTAHYEGFVAGSGEHGHNTNVRSIMKRMRKKFVAVDPAFAEIQNVTCVGYRWGKSKL